MDSIFECGICFKGYNHNEKKPISLPCGHSFCFECIQHLYKNQTIKCPYDKIAHHSTPENLPVNYQVLTALPMGMTQTSSNENNTNADKPVNSVRFCDIHPSKKVKFYCKNDRSMFCTMTLLSARRSPVASVTLKINCRDKRTMFCPEPALSATLRSGNDLMATLSVTGFAASS